MDGDGRPLLPLPLDGTRQPTFLDAAFAGNGGTYSEAHHHRHIAFPLYKERHMDVMDSALTDSEAETIVRGECQDKLQSFIAALQMKRPVSTDKAAILLKHIVKGQMATDASLIAGQMRLDHWELSLANGDNLAVLAERARDFLDTEEGAALYDFFVKVFSHTQERMFD
jgi:hypothetical protein